MKQTGMIFAQAKPMMTKLLLALSLMIPVAAFATEGGNHGGGGGGVYEIEFKRIANNIGAWIRAGNSRGLKLPKGITQEQYKQKMLKAISAYDISIVSKPVLVYGSPKTCRSSIGTCGRNKIVCNYAMFDNAMKSNLDGLYKIIHHEFAGLTLIEKNVGAKSDYVVSEQISAFLQDVTIKMLPVVPQTPSAVTSKRLYSCANTELQLREEGKFEQADDMETITPEAFAEWLRAQPNSPLAKAEKQVSEGCGTLTKDPDAGTGYCGELMDTAPSNGATVSWYGKQTETGSVVRYLETWRARGTAKESFTVLEVEVGYDDALDQSATKDWTIFPKGRSSATLTKITHVDPNDGSRKVLYEGSGLEDEKCSPAVKPKLRKK